MLWQGFVSFNDKFLFRMFNWIEIILTYFWMLPRRWQEKYLWQLSHVVVKAKSLHYTNSLLIHNSAQFDCFRHILIISLVLCRFCNNLRSNFLPWSWCIKSKEITSAIVLLWIHTVPQYKTPKSWWCYIYTLIVGFTGKSFWINYLNHWQFYLCINFLQIYIKHTLKLGCF